MRIMRSLSCFILAVEIYSLQAYAAEKKPGNFEFPEITEKSVADLNLQRVHDGGAAATDDSFDSSKDEMWAQKQEGSHPSVLFFASYCGLPGQGVPFIPVEMEYQSMNHSRQQPHVKFFVSLHDPNDDTVISRGILHGLFGPKLKYPSVTELHSICEFGSTNTATQSSYRMECGNGRLFVEVGAAILLESWNI